MNEFEEFLMFAARFIFILSQKIYDTTLDILDRILYGIHLILWYIRRICLRISVSSFVRTIDDYIFFFNVLKKDVIPAAQCVIACRPGTSGAVAAVFRKCFSADFSPEIPGDALAFPCICMRCRCACIITTVSGTAGRTISNRIQGTPPGFAVLQQSHSNGTSRSIRSG